MSERVDALLAKMTLAEKLGQIQQVNGCCAEHESLVRAGLVGSILNHADAAQGDYVEKAKRFQRIAVEESRLGIPLILGRDVIHGLRTILPIPLGQAASFDEALVEAGAAMAAREAAACGIHWTFAPMVDVARDPRWGRIAESCGEDPLVNARLGAAMVRGFQGADPAAPDRIAACAKHYVGYGAAESGRDYNSTWIPESLLRDVYLPPFRACTEAGALTVMSAFNDLNGVPTSGNALTLRRILKTEWGFDGFVVSDWASVAEMIVHGYCADGREAARAALTAGVDMEMVSTCLAEHVEALLEAGEVSLTQLDEAVGRILSVKERLGLFDNPCQGADEKLVLCSDEHRQTARAAARASCVLLKNEGGLLPLGAAGTVALVGPLAEASWDQLGCWVMDGKPEDTVTVRAALQEALGADRLRYAPGLETSRSTDKDGFAAAVAAAEEADVAVLVLGEEALLSGEAHCRAFLDLPGAQRGLVEAVVATGTPLVAVVMAGRPLVLTDLESCAQALLYAWHPGTMGGPALVDLLLGRAAPAGRLPVSMPQAVGQIPLYYACKNTGRPPREGGRGVPPGTPLDPEGFTSQHIDVDARPLYPFGFGLTYTTFVYGELELESAVLGPADSLEVCMRLSNTGAREGTEVVQLYIRDRVASLTRPVRELKDWQRVTLAPGASATVSFAVPVATLGFHNASMEYVVEPGEFDIWIGGDAASGVHGVFEVVAASR